ncbi:alpha/beta fold hydrolase [Flexithrix dorotheae]|uniref:alpha/beta fold hydrolase n=1 Tax=Flexithrix dorotheae TaxID=70993 RepID=UPI000379229A|nr:alpha/beta hydrolase [Flexithrix dorotheae]
MKTKIFNSVMALVFLSIATISIFSFKDVSLGAQQLKMVYPTQHNTIQVDGLSIFYREAGNPENPTIVLLHGYPTSSYMFRNLITDLSVQYHVLAPDYPGFGRSEQPPMAEFDYTFKHITHTVEGFIKLKKLEKYSFYLMDYGAPIGFRIAQKYPERITSLIIQNGNAYEEGLEDFWIPFKQYWKNKSTEAAHQLEKFHSPEGLKWQYTHGVNDPSLISPDNWEIDMRHLERPENRDIQLTLFYDYQTNLERYPEWQAYFRNYQPKTLIIWGKNDEIFPESGARAYKKDLKNLEFHLYDTGHFALETYGKEMSNTILKFLSKINNQ